jgi:hypothetical protein
VAGSGTLEAEDDGCSRCRATPTSQTDREVRVGKGGAPARAALKAERGAGSGAAVPRSGAALDLNTAQLGSADRGGWLSHQMLDTSVPPDALQMAAIRLGCRVSFAGGMGQEAGIGTGLAVCLALSSSTKPCSGFPGNSVVWHSVQIERVC